MAELITRWTDVLGVANEMQHMPGCPPVYPYNFSTDHPAAIGYRYSRSYEGRHRRPKPNPLYANPTPYGPVWRQRCDYIHSVYAPDFPPFTCTQVYPPVTVYDRVYRKEEWSDVYDAGLTISLVDSDLYTPLRLGVKDVSMNLAEFIGEYKDTCTTVATGFKAVVDTVRFVRDVARGKRARPTFMKRRYGGLTSKNWKRYLGRLPSAMVATDFGISPMIQGVSDALDTWDKRALLPLKRRITATRTEEKRHEVAETVYYEGEYSSVTRQSRRGIIYVTYTPDVGAFTSGNILEAGWAAIPFSFLLDKFVDVGGFLSSLDAMSGTLGMVGTITTRTVNSVFSTQIARGTGKKLISPGKLSYVGFQRTVITDLPLTLPSWKPSGSYRLLRDLTGILASFHLGR
jgi:hypothetical protein